MRWIETVEDALVEARDADDHCCMQCTNDALALLADEVERLRGIEARVTEWFEGTDLTHPSVSEVAIHDTMADILGRE